MSKILLVDGHSIANRAFYGLPPLTNSKGIHTNALLGFFNILMKVMEEVGPDELGVAFDLHEPTFRHLKYKEYKGTRSAMPEELLEQIPILMELLETAGIRLLTKAGFEADDLIGTEAKRHGRLKDEVYILSGDRDLLQLVDDEITMLLPKTQGGKTTTLVYHPAEVEQTYGVSPAGYLQMKALMGDSSDNIPGVPSIGEKTASKIIQTFGTLENALAHISEVKPPRASQNLKAYESDARLSLDLATICTEVEDCPEATKLTDEMFHQDAFINLLKTYELKSLLQKFQKADTAPRQAAVKSAGAENRESVIGAEGEEMSLQSSLFDMPEEELSSPDRAEDLKALFEEALRLYDAAAGEASGEADEVKVVPMLCLLPCMDVEPNQMMGTFLGLAAVLKTKNDTRCVYAEGDLAELLPELLKALQAEGLRKVFFDLKPFLKLVKAAAPEAEISLNPPYEDLMVEEYLLNATKGKYSIDELSASYLGDFILTEDELLGTGVHRQKFADLTQESRTGYLKKNVKVLSACADPIQKRIADEDMQSLYNDIEAPLIQVLAGMELEGIRCDKATLDEISSFLQKEVGKLSDEIYELAGEKFNLNSTKQLGEVLFEKLGLPAGKKTKSGYSTAAEVLETLRGYHPIIGRILSYRQLSKLDSTYAKGLVACIQADGKIHCTFQQTVTATGRLSCVDPNLQNIPIREEMGRQLRRAFLPKNEDYFFMDADYSQIELRLLAHMSGDENMIRAYQNGQDIHRLTASEVLHIPYDEVTSKQRSEAKAVNFGIVYGMSAFSLSGDLGITVQEATQYINHYFERFPMVKKYLDDSVKSAKERGYGVTLYGRRRNIEELKAKNFALRSFGERVAKNMPIQGTAADIIKIAMIKVDERLKREMLKSKLILQVHDELLIETYRPEEAAVRAILEEEMTSAAALKVPFDVDVHTGENWYEAK